MNLCVNLLPDQIVRHVEMVERYWRTRNLLQHVVAQEEFSDAHQAPECSSLDYFQPVVTQIHVKQCWYLTEGVALYLLQVVETEVEMSDCQERSED